LSLRNVLHRELSEESRAALILGVTGGIASGKSTVAEMFQDLGVPMIDFDLLARDVVSPGQPAWEEIVNHFGSHILCKDGSLDRKKLSRIVFADPQKRKALESITHPRIVDLFLSKAKALLKDHRNAIIQAVIPLLFEAGLEDLVDKIVVVYVPRRIQIERLMRRDNISLQHAEDILNAQMPIEEKLRYADFVVRNEKGLEETRRQVKIIWESLKRAHERRN